MASVHTLYCPNHPGVFVFTVSAKFALHTAPSQRLAPRDHFRQINQILPTEGTPAGSNGNKWIWCNSIRPTRWERAQRALPIVEVDAVLSPVVAIDNQLILLVEQRMKRVRHPERWS